MSHGATPARLSGCDDDGVPSSPLVGNAGDVEPGPAGISEWLEMDLQAHCDGEPVPASRPAARQC